MYNLDFLLELLCDLPDRVLLRFVLLTLIDCELLRELTPPVNHAHIEIIRNTVLNYNFGENATWLRDAFMELVRTYGTEQKHYIFNTIANIFIDSSGEGSS